MALLDALSGKVWHWNATRLEVHKELFPRFRSVPSEKEFFRNFFFAYYCSFFCVFGELVFSESPNVRARSYTGRIKSLNKHSFVNMIASYFSDSLTRCFSCSESEEMRNGGACLLLDSCMLLGKDRSYAERRFATYVNGDTTESVIQLIADISYIMGLDSGSEWEMAPWLMIRDEIESRTEGYCSVDNWCGLVSRELSREPRVGGYMDSILN